MKTKQFILLGLISSISLSACSVEEKSGSEEKPVNVEVYTPITSPESSMFVSGTVTAPRHAIISTRVMGFVDKIYVRQGDEVKEGELLMVINSDDLKAKKAQAEAMVAEANAAAVNAVRDYERYKVLHEKKSVSDKELENMELNRISVESRLQMAVQSLNEIDAMLAYTNIRAPFSGTVTQKMIDEGSMANPGMPLLGVEQSDKKEIMASVPENYMPFIQLGDSVQIDIKSLDKQIKGFINEISPSSSLTGGQYAIKVSLCPDDNEYLHSGMYAAIHIPYKNRPSDKNGIWIEASSIIVRDQLKGVFVVTPENQAMLRWIRIGKETGDKVEVLSGLDASDRIIRHTEAKLYNGKKVKITD